jgi:ABC-type transport system involved in cytochrome c biogenesis permease subunit
LLTIQESAAQLNAQIEAHLRQWGDTSTNLPAEQLQAARTKMREVAAKAAQIARLANQAQFTAFQLVQFGNRYSLYVVPALDPAALDRKREPGHPVSPWLDLSVVLSASEELKDYPQPEIEEVRRAFESAAAAYRDRLAPNRPKRFGDAMERFALALAALGEAIEPLRQKLPIPNRDADLMARTACPPLGATWLEVHYNRLDPFLWTWVLSLAALVALFGAVGPLRGSVLLLGIGLMAAAVLMMIYGFALRTAITGYTPVATMFETVAFVALVVASLGLSFAVVPLLSRGWRLAWQWTAIRGAGIPDFRSQIPSPKSEVPSPKTQGPPEDRRSGLWSLVFGLRCLAVLARVGLAVGVFYVLTQIDFGAAEPAKGEPAVLLLPRVGFGASMPTLGELLIWIVGLALLAAALYYLPRAILAAVIALATVPLTLARHGLAEPLQQVRARKPILVCGAAIAVLAGCAGYYVPVFDPSIKSLMPILRHSFWLAVHVMTIIASYGAGALAWALSNVSLGYFLFGRYRRVVVSSRLAVVSCQSATENRQLPTANCQLPTLPEAAFQSPAAFAVRLAPEACARLSAYVYKLVQIAMVLLYVGTVLGAVWADKAWGRYWGWDPKEVWALVSLLIYLFLVHGRHVGWIGNFGLAVGMVIEATAMMMTWYGITSGKHAYGSSGPIGWMFLAVTINWAFAAAAWFRCWLQTRASQKQ